MDEHKANTRRRILEAASRVLRREGYAGAGVDALAAEAGLTSGAIYGHFSGKREVLTEVVKESLAANEDIREKGLENLTGEEWIRGMLRRYLSPEHHAAVESGCPMPALISELGRAGEAPRQAFAESVERLVERMQRKWLEAEERDGDSPGAGGAGAVRERVFAGLAMAVGGVALARAIGDDDFAQELLEACRGTGVEVLTAHADPESTQELKR